MQADSRFTVRHLAPADLDALRQLNALFAREFDDAHAYAAAPPDDAYCRATLARDNVVVLVATIGGTVVGGLVAYELHKLERARSEIYIYDLAVDQAQRRRGIATQLIGQLQSIAKQRGAWVVYVQADHGDEPAIALYNSLGVREDVLHFDLPVR